MAFRSDAAVLVRSGEQAAPLAVVELLLSDCVHDAGPRLTAARLPRLAVLPDTSGEQHVELGRGRFRLVRGHRDAAAALTADAVASLVSDETRCITAEPPSIDAGAQHF